MSQYYIVAIWYSSGRVPVAVVVAAVVVNRVGASGPKINKADSSTCNDIIDLNLIYIDLTCVLDFLNSIYPIYRLNHSR